MRKISLVLTVAGLCVGGASSRPARADVVPSTSGATVERYTLTVHVTSGNGKPLGRAVKQSFPVVVARKGNTIALGGKYGPQLVGVTNGAHFTASVPGNIAPSVGQAMFTGTTPSGGSSGTFSWKTTGGVSLTGSFELSAYMPGATGSFTGGSGTKGQLTTPTGGAVGQNGTATAPGTRPAGAPGMANGGPNLAGTPVGGAAAGGTDSDGWSTNPKLKKFGDTGGSSSSSDSGKSTWQSIKDWFSSWTSVGSNNGSTDGGSAKPPASDPPAGGGDDSAMDDRQRTYGGGTNKLGPTKIGGGQDSGGSSTDRGGQASGGKNAQGQAIAVKPNSGDNPFEVSKSDVLNDQKLVDPAKDPVFGPGGFASSAAHH